MKQRIKNTDFTIKIIAWFQIIGGICGIGLIGYLAINSEDINFYVALILLIGFALFVFSIYAGSKLITRDSLRLGIILSIINQVLQILQFKMGGYGFNYTSGAQLLVGYNEGFKFNFGIASSTIYVSINGNDSEFYLMINVLAIVLLLVLADIWEEKIEVKETLEIAEVKEVKFTMDNPKK